ncbi:hypothetical protein CC86DRAFT_390590 [Ophiobolus disseminans]|uniref:Uncharacterized protein n=1 Tax=Ophiobolus disseminans TaxID=1469910 RepID=A0A6A7AGY8_9PLEO|nr:hypothetical protein CC86DRAFT_390590 [Ophiobolus disseminans]
MRSSTYVALFAGSATAQSSVTLLNVLPNEGTLTQIGADATATTYTKSCLSAIPSIQRKLTPLPTPRASASSYYGGFDVDEYEICVPYTLKQGASTWTLHMEDSQAGGLELDANCNWQGPLTDADLTCTVTASGTASAVPILGVSSTAGVIRKDELASLSVLRAVAIVSETGAPGASHSVGLASGPVSPTGVMLLVVGAVGVLAAALAL